MSDSHNLTDRDRERLEERGISEAEAQRQLRLLRSPPRAFVLERPCTPGDGIRVLDEEELRTLADEFREAARAGRASKFVPASGAATRMFRTLTSLWTEDPFPDDETLAERRAEGDPAARDLHRLRKHLDRFPFLPALRDELARRGRAPEEVSPRELLSALLAPDGLDLGNRAKGLVPFHRYPDGEVRTAFEEHLLEGAGYVRDDGGISRFHFTVAPDQWEAFHRAAEVSGPALGAPEIRFRVAFSTQSPSTDTLAVTPEGAPFRDPDGNLLLRPGGHGALIGNLAETARDLVFLKNIDNVLPRERHDEVARWQQALGGLLVRTESRIHELLRRMEDPGDETALEEARRLVENTLGLEPPGEDLRDWLNDRLDRPLRVAGVVPVTGEPGGGPFWVRRPDGSVTPQIVEEAEIDTSSTDQAEIFEGSTHFNPVQIVGSLRDRRGRPYELDEFIDEDAVFVSEKSHGGRPLLALERPGLWNGAMAGWNTLFVEIPGRLFAPVKTVFDLLRSAHQPGSRP
ncbi:MAG: DUF4301 family protein [Thermoanaerobaculia bacterium]|nr:DUF4301 family protein [Thermoanaerobaculia bacterium]